MEALNSSTTDYNAHTHKFTVLEVYNEEILKKLPYYFDMNNSNNHHIQGR